MLPVCYIVGFSFPLRHAVCRNGCATEASTHESQINTCKLMDMEDFEEKISLSEASLTCAASWCQALLFPHDLDEHKDLLRPFQHLDVSDLGPGLPSQRAGTHWRAEIEEHDEAEEHGSRPSQGWFSTADDRQLSLLIQSLHGTGKPRRRADPRGKGRPVWHSPGTRV